MRPTGGARYPADLGFSKFTATCFRLCGWLYPALCVNSRSKLLYQIRTLLGYYVHDWLSNWTFMFVVLSGEYVGNTNIAQTQIISWITLRTYCPCECELSTQMCVHKDSHIHLCFYFAWSTQTPKCKACTIADRDPVSKSGSITRCCNLSMFSCEAVAKWTLETAFLS